MTSQANISHLKVNQLYHTRLDSKHIRLLKSSPSSSSNDDLQYTLESFNLAEAPSYVALSYTWGPPEEPDSHGQDNTTREFNPVVFVNGCNIFVTQNLFDGLVVLRQKAIDGFLWVDAICINQQDISERSSQVSVMDLIYSGADHVVVWLGPDTRQEAQEVSKIFRKLSQYWDDIESVSNWDALDQPGYVIADRAGLPGLRAAHAVQDDDQVLAWKPVISLFQQRWFHRTWTVQEVVLATHVRVLYGDTELSWKDLWNSGRLFSETNLGDTLGTMFALSRMLHSIASGDYDNLDVIDDSEYIATKPGSTFRGIMLLSTLCAADRAGGHSDPDVFLPAIAKVGGREYVQDSIAGMIVLVLSSITEHQATDPRDKIYGTLGLLSAAAQTQGMRMPDIKVDYTKQSEAVFLDIAQCVLSKTSLLSYLNFVQDISHRHHQSLPSWVAEFGSLRSYPLVWHEAMTNMICFDASDCYSRVERKAAFKIVETTLRCRGAYLGEVKHVSQPLKFLQNSAIASSRCDLGKHLDKIAEMVTTGGETYHTGECRVEALWRTLVFDTANSIHPAPVELGVSFRYWLLMMVHIGHYIKAKTSFEVDYYQSAYQHYDLLARSDTSRTVPTQQALEDFAADVRREEVTRLSELDHKAEAYLSLASRCMLGRRFFITDDGYMCVGLESTAPGDSVWILEGGPTPFVLRDVEDTNAKAEKPQARRMMLVGECYVHGIMHGEALEKDGFAWQDILLV